MLACRAGTLVTKSYPNTVKHGKNEPSEEKSCVQVIVLKRASIFRPPTFFEENDVC
jgi:hypothetical protein